MYGLEGILGNLVTSVATPAIGGLAGDAITKSVVDNTMPELLKEMTQTTIGTLSGAAVGAGLGYLTGGKSGAVSGAITGGIGGGVGGYNAPQISQMFGIDQGTPQSVGAPVPSQPQSSPLPPVSNAQLQAQDPFMAAISPRQSDAQLNAVRSPISTAPQSPVPSAPIPDSATSAAPAPDSPEYKDYLDFLKKNYEKLAGGFYLGSAYGANQDSDEQAKKFKQSQLLAELVKNEEAKKFAQSVYAPGRAAGGPVELGIPASGAMPEMHLRVPAWAQEKIQREGGLAALQPGIRQGMAGGGSIEERVSPYQSAIERKAAEAIQQQEASEGRALSGSEKQGIRDSTRTRILNDAELGLGYVAPSKGLGSHLAGLRGKANGGYINLQPMGEDAYPQSQIPRAQPYAAASPQRREVVQDGGDYYARGGLIDGHGDGMSDSIPARISGKEPVKVAQGEYVIPKEVAAKYGPEKLRKAMTEIRKAAHAKKGQQVIQDAGKKALIRTLSGVRA